VQPATRSSPASCTARISNSFVAVRPLPATRGPSRRSRWRRAGTVRNAGLPVSTSAQAVRPAVRARLSRVPLSGRGAGEQRRHRVGVAVDVELVTVDADLEQQSLQERDAKPAEVFRLERGVELAALLGGAGERLEAGAQALDAGADSGVELRVALLLAD